MFVCPDHDRDLLDTEQQLGLRALLRDLPAPSLLFQTLGHLYKVIKQSGTVCQIHLLYIINTNLNKIDFIFSVCSTTYWQFLFNLLTVFIQACLRSEVTLSESCPLTDERCDDVVHALQEAGEVLRGRVVRRGDLSHDRCCLGPGCFHAAFISQDIR